MHVKLKLAAAAIALMAAGAQATVFEWDDHDILETQTVKYGKVHSGQAFEDFFTFELDDPSHLWTAAVSANLINRFRVEQGSVELFAGTYGDNVADVSLGAYAFDGSTGSTDHQFSNLAAGDYYYKVNGVITGTLGGQYVLTSTIAPVPEPETYALMGLGLAGLIAARRKKHQAK
ncbi:FxDxF family PEP-CTERM protein [Chitiniphilus purpureus]|uniref:FxDxF family PEP-CTERM protein n=1 Tax=Chitiniphilus purpureus TaxID=2981137 RepID=A0ABY6DJW3_9NEIS|nr:FxDxF family PEP-CTERM protein [Chitiniphilus sp. CD1]UXY14622.1 FxDxF family PEP-CTERM protein [Chitiniphilus sp. CD1]